MSKGLGKVQTTIMGLLTGKVRAKCFASGGELTTPELVDELVAAELIPEATPRAQQLHTVRRACESLLRRGLVEGVYTTAEPATWAKVISWKAAASDGPNA